MRSVTVSLNKRQYAILENQAKKSGITVYAFCKSAILTEISSRTPNNRNDISEIEELKREIIEIKELVNSKL